MSEFIQNIVSQRFRDVLELIQKEYLIGSMVDFCDKIDYSRQSLNEILKGRRDVTIEVLRKLFTIFPVNPTYIFTGEKPILILNENHLDGTKFYDHIELGNVNLNVNPSVNPIEQIPFNEPAPAYNKSIGMPIIVTVDNSGRENITLVDTKAAAGYIARINEPEFYKTLPSFSLPSNVLKNGTFRAFRVSGDSMSPMIKHGAIVIGQLLMDWSKDIKDGRLYIIVGRNVDGDDIVIKRVINRIEERGHLLLKSDNSGYSSFTIDSEDVMQAFEWKCTINFDGSNPLFDLTAAYQRLENEIMDIREDKKRLK
jgi:transcriptional regulator with XRE-family HTH domain